MWRTQLSKVNFSLSNLYLCFEKFVLLSSLVLVPHSHDPTLLRQGCGLKWAWYEALQIAMVKAPGCETLWTRVNFLWLRLEGWHLRAQEQFFENKYVSMQVTQRMIKVNGMR